jgi:hypothetical protein
MSVYPLQSVLELRQREEDAAAERLVDATRRRAEAQERHARLVAAADTARAHLDRARQVLDDQGRQNSRGERSVAGISMPGATASAAASFVARRRDELKQARDALARFREGPLAEARNLETAARNDHLTARRAREAFAKHAERYRAAERRTVGRREEETLEDAARAARHGRLSKADT